MRSLECFNPHRKLISKPDQAVTKDKQKVFDKTDRRKKRVMIYAPTLMSEQVRDSTRVFLSLERKTVTGKRDGNPDSDLSEDSGLAALEI